MRKKKVWIRKEFEYKNNREVAEKSSPSQRVWSLGEQSCS